MTKLLKAILLNASCQLAAAVVENTPDTGSVDPTIADPNIRNENIMAVKEVEIYYDWLIKALNSDGANDAFKDPVAGDLLAGFDPSKLSGLAGLIPTVGPLLQQVLGLLKPTSTAPAPASTALPAPSAAAGS